MSDEHHLEPRGAILASASAFRATIERSPSGKADDRWARRQVEEQP